jgi:hypothetical protein
VTQRDRQSRLMSLTEAVVNVVLGYAMAVVSQLVVFPLFDLRVSFGDTLLIGAFFTAISILRSYSLRRLFDLWRKPLPDNQAQKRNPA